ncbi:hypothetical protein SAMN05428984_4077 [Sphingomonas sp. OK281]|nr:hypothetical protein SAMN05428984_4077 [Sphingomonas sp. OK281]
MTQASKPPSGRQHAGAANARDRQHRPLKFRPRAAARMAAARGFDGCNPIVVLRLGRVVGQASRKPSTGKPLLHQLAPGWLRSPTGARYIIPGRAMSLSRLLPSTVNMAPVMPSPRPPCWTVTTSRTTRDRFSSFGENSDTIAVHIDPIAVRSRTTTRRDQGSLTTVRPDVTPIVPRSRHSYSQGPRRWLATVWRRWGGHGRRLQHRCDSRVAGPCVARDRGLCQSFLHAWLPP